jgi:superfamily II DNA or RNA helicase
MYIPLSQWETLWDEFPSSKDEYPKTNVKFEGVLYTKETDPKGRGRDQDVVFKEAVSRLKDKHCCFIAAFTGFGKSAMGIYLAAYFKLKTAVICHSDIIKEQWKEEFERFTNAKVQIVKGKKPLDPTASIYIMGIQKSSTIPRSWLEVIGFVIVDEAHICTETAFTASLLRFQPMYIVGFSATPDRNDGLHKLLYMYFGPLNDFICRSEVKNFTVTKYVTQYKPKINYRMVMQKLTLDWNLVMSSLAENEDRQKEIVRIAIKHPKEKIIILSSLKVQSNGIYDKLIEAGESAELLIGSKKKWDKSKRILVAGTKKGGVGLNDPSLTMLILASSAKDVRQFEGRIRTTDNLIYDIVDDHKTLEKHWEMREEWYEERGATIVYEGCKQGSSIKSAYNSKVSLPLERFSGRK